MNIVLQIYFNVNNWKAFNPIEVYIFMTLNRQKNPRVLFKENRVIVFKMDFISMGNEIAKLV